MCGYLGPEAEVEEVHQDIPSQLGCLVGGVRHDPASSEVAPARAAGWIMGYSYGYSGEIP